MLLGKVVLPWSDSQKGLEAEFANCLQQSITGEKGGDKEWYLNHPSKSKPSLKTMLKNVQHFRLLQVSSFQIFSLLFFSFAVTS